jgi:CBS domain-containing protein
MRVREAMQPDVVSIGPEQSLAELERLLAERRLGGLPVVERERLVGVVSRSDILRLLGVERAIAEAQADVYRELLDDPFVPSERAAREEAGQRRAVEEQIAHRMATLRVRDAMTPAVISVPADASVREAAARIAERRVHRVIVTEGERLAGVLSALDVVRLVAEGRLG